MHAHSHPNGGRILSGLDGKNNAHGGNDTKMKNFYNNWYPGRTSFYIYAKGSTDLIKF